MTGAAGEESRIINPGEGEPEGQHYDPCILGIPCITCGETLDDGWNVLVGTDHENIRAQLRAEKPAALQQDLYATGASRKVRALLKGGIH